MVREGALETPAPLRRQRRRRQRQRIWLPPGEAWTYVKARRADVRRDLRVLGGEIFDGAAKPTRGEEVAAEARLPRIGGGVEHSDGGGARRAGRTARGGGWALSLLVGIIWSVCVKATPMDNVDCAEMVPLEEVRRGKGAFYSDCLTLSVGTDLGGCWTQEKNDNTTGCQTCYITETAFSSTLFPVVFFEELDPCPTSMDYTAFYGSLFGADIALVTAESLISPACLDGWLYSADTGHCYLKSINTAKAANQAEAAERCAADDGWLIAIDDVAENEFLLHNMLWIGFFGETYTGLVKSSPTAEWTWPIASAAAAAAADDFACLTDYSDWLEGASVGCSASYNGESGKPSCMEIYPYEPKEWNPFSCEVGKHYVCEAESSGIPVEDGTSSISSSSSNSSSSITNSSTNPATPAPTTRTINDTSATLSPSSNPVPLPTPTPTPSKKTTPRPLAVTQGPVLSAVPTPGPLAPPVAATMAPMTTPGPTAESQSYAPSNTTTTDSPVVEVTVYPTGTGTMVETSPPDSPGRLNSSLAPSSAPVDPDTWAGNKRLSVNKSGSWGTATYSLYAVRGEHEVTVAEDVTKLGLSKEEDTYFVRSGCYRLQVTAGSDPTEFLWSVDGGEASSEEFLSSGNGLDGSLLSVQGGVCGIGSCEASCLAQHFSDVDHSLSTCDGLRTLVEGVCEEACTGEEVQRTPAEFQQDCVRSGCIPNIECGVAVADIDLDVQHTLSLKALLEVDAGTTSMTSNSNSGGERQSDFEDTVALWLGVQPTEVTVLAVNGVGVAVGQSARRRLSWRSPLTASVNRMLQSSSDAASGSEYTRYVVSVSPENANSSRVSGLMDVVTDTEGSANLEKWLADSSRSWGAASVRELDAEALATIVMADVPDDDTPGGGSDAWYASNLFATGGVAAAVVVVLGLLIMMCCSWRHKRSKSSVGSIRRRSSNAGSRDMQGGGSGSILYLGSDSGSSSEFFYNNAVNSNRFNGGGGAGITDIPEDQTVGMSSSSTLTKSKSFRKKQELLNPSRSSSVSLLQAGTLSTGTDSNDTHRTFSPPVSDKDGHGPYVEFTTNKDEIRGPELLADGLELNPMQPVSVPTAATDTAVEPDRAEPPSVPKKNPTILSSKHTNHVRTGSVTSSVGTSAASTKQASIPGPNGALNMIGLGRGFSTDSFDEYTYQNVMGARQQTIDPNAPVRETAAESLSRRESAKAAERAQAMEQRRQLQPRQFSLENTILPSPSADFAMAEGLAPTPTIIDAEGSNNSWGRAGSSEEEAFEARESPANPHAAAPGPATGYRKSIRSARPPGLPLARSASSTSDIQVGGVADDGNATSCSTRPPPPRQVFRSFSSVTEEDQINGDQDSESGSRAPYSQVTGNIRNSFNRNVTVSIAANGHVRTDSEFNLSSGVGSSVASPEYFGAGMSFESEGQRELDNNSVASGTESREPELAGPWSEMGMITTSVKAREGGFDSEEEDVEGSVFNGGQFIGDSSDATSGGDGSVMTASTPGSSAFYQRYQREGSGEMEDDEVSDITDTSESCSDRAAMSAGSANSWMQPRSGIDPDAHPGDVRVPRGDRLRSPPPHHFDSRDRDR